MKATLLYTLARVGVFVVAFAALRYTPMSVFLAAAIAAVIALLISYIFFGRLRDGVAKSIVRRRVAPERDEDADLEDAVLDGALLDGALLDGAAAAPTASSSASAGPAASFGSPSAAARVAPSAPRRAAPPAEDD